MYDRLAIRKQYAELLKDDFMPFWKRACDTQRGGVFTCFSNDGARLLSTDKYIWSQGRLIWMFSRYVAMIDRGLIDDPDRDFFLAQAMKTYEFVRDNAILPEGEGVCAYLTREDGQKKESIPGKGYYTSYFVDCFVMMGFAELAKLTGDSTIFQEALALYGRTRDYFDAGRIVSEPYPQPKGFAVQANAMIMANVTDVLGEAARALGHPRQNDLLEDAVRFTKSILEDFYIPETGLLREHAALEPQHEDTLFANYTCPGHAIESMWFCRNIIRKAGMEGEYLRRMRDVVKSSVRVGWDEEQGGLLRYVGFDGKKPGGRLLDDPQEQALVDTWDSKLWWPHAEALYTTLLCYEDSGDADFLEMYERLRDYCFRVFPNPDRGVGEWIQILDRDNRPMEKVVALPVKDPYHIARAFMLIVELMAEKIKEEA